MAQRQITSQQPVVQACGLSFAYPAAEGEVAQPVLAGVDFHVEQGAFCVVTGPTGCGKTTLLRLLKPELAPVGARSGRIEVLGCDLMAGAMTPIESAQSVGFVMQDPSAQIVCDTVWHELAFGLENIGMPQDQMRRRVAEVAHFFGIEPWVRRDTESLSGGQKQLVNLAAVLALRPKLLLLDEPTAQLDPVAVKQFLFMLSRVNRELGITVVVATHAPEDMAPYATQCFELGATGTAASLGQAQTALASRHAQRAEKFGWTSTVALSLRDAHVRFGRNEPWVLRGMDLDVARGSVHAIVGGNGCGKTTALRCLAGVLKPQRGSVHNALAASQAMLPQDPKALFVCDTVREELMEWSQRCGYAEADAQAMARRFALDGCVSRHPYDLSGGQQQKLALAKLLLANPQLLLLDEPTKGLDPQSCAELSHIVWGLADEGRTIVLVTHDLDFAFTCADAVSMLFDGEVAATEPVQVFFQNNLVYRPNAESRLFALIAAEGAQGCADER